MNKNKKKQMKQLKRQEATVKFIHAIWQVLKKFLTRHLQLILVIIITLMVAIIPNIVYAQVITLSPLERVNWITSSATYFDFFSFAKSQLFVQVTALVFSLFIFGLVTKIIKFKWMKVFIPVIVYVLFVIISTVFSEDLIISTRGFVEMHQGLWVLLSYSTLILIMPSIVTQKIHVKLILSGFLFVGLMQAIIGGMQYFGYDPFKQEWGQLLMLPSQFESLRSVLEFKFPDFNIYGTLYNTNFVGSFAALLIPVSFGLYFYSTKWYYKMMSLIFTGLMIFVGYGSNSRAGLLGIGASLVLILLLFIKSYLKKPFIMIIPFLTILIIGFALNSVTEGKVLKEIQSLNLFEALSTTTQRIDERFMYETIDVEGYNLIIETNEFDLSIQKFNDTFMFFNGNQQLIPFNYENGVYASLSEEYEDIVLEEVVTVSNLYILSIRDDKMLIQDNKESLLIYSFAGKFIDPGDVEFVKWMQGYETLFTNRVYIWSRSIPILKDTLLIGLGPDMYITAFPQDDFLAEINDVGWKNVIVDKPHNMYLQIAINTGVVSLVAMLILWSWYIIESFKLYGLKELKSFESIMGVSVSLSVVAYLVTGMFNDQIISVAPLFYILTGLGLALNQINLRIKKDDFN
jgi:O-antigen ligase